VILLDTIIKTAIEPALALLPPKMDKPEARVILLAIGMQEKPLHVPLPEYRGALLRKRSGAAPGRWSAPAG
jgi:hypothetical protein